MFNSIKYFYQRGRRGWADCDVWNLDTYLVRVVSESLVALGDTTHGYPARLDDLSTEDKSQLWLDTLTDIASAFIEYIVAAENYEPVAYITKARMHLLIDNLEDLWD